MNAFDSECSSGCESGWTLYLDHSNLLNHHNDSHEKHISRAANLSEDEEEEEEDLSMLSDASSGPPHHHANYFNKPVRLAKKSTGTKKHNKVIEDQQHLPSFLHDTASSPLFDFSQNNVTGTSQQQSYTGTGSMLDYSQGQGFSTTYFQEGRSSSFQEEHLGFLQPSQSNNKLQGNNRRHEGRGMGMR